LFSASASRSLIRRTQKYWRSYFPAAQRASANSIIASGLACGPAFGMLLGGVLMSRFGWRSFFVVLGYSSTLALRRILAE